MAIGMSGVNLNGLIVSHHSFLIFALSVECDAQAIVCIHGMVFELDRGSVG